MSKSNIIPHEFKPGQSGNPKGRPKGSRSISDMLRQYLETNIKTPYDVNHPETGEKIAKMKAKDFIALNLITKAIKGSKEEIQLKATELIQDRMEGKAIQKIEPSPGPIDDRKGALDNLKVIAKREGLSIEEFCDREDIDIKQIEGEEGS